MTARIACSACGAAIEAGDQHCSGCGLQLGALAVRVHDPQPARLPFWIIALIAFLGVVFLAYALDQIRPQRSAEDAWVADVQAGRLSTADAFQARCGRAKEIWTERRGTFLKYQSRFAWDRNVVVWFQRDGQIYFGESAQMPDLQHWEGEKMDASFAWRDLDCH